MKANKSKIDLEVISETNTPSKFLQPTSTDFQSILMPHYITPPEELDDFLSSTYTMAMQPWNNFFKTESDSFPFMPFRDTDVTTGADITFSVNNFFKTGSDSFPFKPSRDTDVTTGADTTFSDSFSSCSDSPLSNRDWNFNLFCETEMFAEDFFPFSTNNSLDMIVTETIIPYVSLHDMTCVSHPSVINTKIRSIINDIDG